MTRRTLQSTLVAGLLMQFASVVCAQPLGDKRVWVSPPEHVKATTASTSTDDADAELLARYGILPDVLSLGEYLRGLHPGGDVRQYQAALIARLGDPVYQRREAATRELARMPQVSADLLQRAMQHHDPEVRWRSKHLLDTQAVRSSEILQAVFSIIERKRITGLAAEVLAAMSHVSESHLVDGASRALKATSLPTDGELLKRHLTGKRRAVRLASIAALEATLGAAADKSLAPLAADADRHVQVAVARAFIEHGNRAALPLLGRLLGADELQVRLDAVRILRAATGQRLRFVAYDPAEKRAADTARWRKWLADAGATAELKFPLRKTKFILGLTLIANYNQNKIVELNDRGEVVWEKQVGRHPWGVQGLPNGHRVVSFYSDRSIIEYDRSGKEVWKKLGLPGGPTSVQRLENGNTLVACTDAQQVVEYDRSGKAVWKAGVTGRPSDARRLENGHTLVALQSAHKVVEVDRAGKEVWTLEGVRGPFSAERLDNGNTLVAQSGAAEIAEYNPKGEKVWSKTGVSAAYCAQRLPDGTTLIGHYQGIIHVDREGKELMRKPMMYVSKMHRY